MFCVLQSKDVGFPNFPYVISSEDILSDSGNCFKVDNPSYKKFATFDLLVGPVGEFIDPWGVSGNARECGYPCLEYRFSSGFLCTSINFSPFFHVFLKLLISYRSYQWGE